MEANNQPGHILFLAIYLITSSCAYFNTLYNAQQYFNEAEKIRLAKEGKAIPLSAMEKYGKTIQNKKGIQCVIDTDKIYTTDKTLS